MATYSFRIKKGKFQLELSTSDKELLVEQFELWVRSAKKYVNEKKAKECKDLVNFQIKAEEEVTKKNIENEERAFLEAKKYLEEEELKAKDKIIKKAF